MENINITEEQMIPQVAKKAKGKPKKLVNAAQEVVMATPEPVKTEKQLALEKRIKDRELSAKIISLK